MLSREEIRRAVARMEEETARRRAAAGYARIAYGSIADAVRLAFAVEVPADLDEMDLYAVSEIKRSKTGVEIKFHDRLKALDRLSELSETDADRAAPFYRALEQAAERLEPRG
ncbi:MAG: terminase small subunit [Clostridia bacterium]|nr:terminase small subunit [Clostridia bacterium]